jgi:hypothetical protein
MMHGNMNIRFIHSIQAKGEHTYKNIKRKLYRKTAAIWLNKTRRDKQLTHNYINIRINGKTKSSSNTSMIPAGSDIRV